MLEQLRHLIGRRESLPTIPVNRVLILCAGIGEGMELTNELQAYLEERKIPNPRVEFLRDAAFIIRAFLDQDKFGNPHPPRGVVLLPEMRQYSPTGMGMTLETYECGIDKEVEKLCGEYGVPLVKIQSYNSPKQITEGVKELLVKNE